MASFRLTKEFRFEASHKLVQHDGQCARLHGHSWRGALVCEGESLITSGPKQNMLVDFADMKAAVNEIVEAFDHQHLNDILGVDMPTSEYLATVIYDIARQSLPSLSAVVIEETCTSRCEYRA